MAVRVFWVADMLDLLSPSVLLMTAGPDPREKRPGCQGRAQRARRAWPCGPAALGYKGRTYVQHRTRKGRRQGKAQGTRRRDLGLRHNDKRFERRTAIAEAVDGHFGCPRRLVAGRQFPLGI